MPVALEGYYKDQIFDRRELRFEIEEEENATAKIWRQDIIQGIGEGQGVGNNLELIVSGPLSRTPHVQDVTFLSSQVTCFKLGSLVQF